MYGADAAAQLERELLSSVQDGLRTKRPILVHVNADTTWLLQLPYPPGATKPPNRSRFNILLDPWLKGSQSDVAAWFSSQWHTINSCVPSIADLNRVIYENEELEGGRDPGAETKSRIEVPNRIDAVIVSHEFTDHCHKQTLHEIHPATPIIATNAGAGGAANLIKSWRYFESVFETPSFSESAFNWQTTSSWPLPDWIGISRIVSASDVLNYHSAVVIAFRLNRVPSGGGQCLSQDPEAEAVIYTPHGIFGPDLRCVKAANPPLRTLALLHGLHDIRISVKQLNLGAHNGLQAQRMCGAKYWIGTHDEIKHAGGFVKTVLHRKVLTLKDALLAERKERGEIKPADELVEMADVSFVDLASGESLLLL